MMMALDSSEQKKFHGVDKRFAVATHAMCVLAFRSPEYSSAQLISENISISPIIIKRILGLIAKMGVVETALGATGGYRLARSPEVISLWDILIAVQGGGPFSNRFGTPESNCAEGKAIDNIVYSLYSHLDSKIEDILSSITLASILRAANSDDLGELLEQ